MGEERRDLQGGGAVRTRWRDLSRHVAGAGQRRPRRARSDRYLVRGCSWARRARPAGEAGTGHARGRQAPAWARGARSAAEAARKGEDQARRGETAAGGLDAKYRRPSSRTCNTKKEGRQCRPSQETQRRLTPPREAMSSLAAPENMCLATNGQQHSIQDAPVGIVIASAQMRSTTASVSKMMCRWRR